ncbi:response regulator [Vibrio kyushuensis]|uniref:response regulator n=1 Tax=Vibrio kyushuensis TaxID=2910249 RepID=UPI003D0DC057
MQKYIKILLVEDNLGDARLTLEAMSNQNMANNVEVIHLEDGEIALHYLTHTDEYGQFGEGTYPDFILLDLNLPKVSGWELLDYIKSDERLRSIPVAVLSSSDLPQDINRAYSHYANCYITKPVDFSKFTEFVKAIDCFWFSAVQLPSGAYNGEQYAKC